MTKINSVWIKQAWVHRKKLRIEFNPRQPKTKGLIVEYPGLGEKELNEILESPSRARVLYLILKPNADEFNDGVPRDLKTVIPYTVIRESE